MNKTLALQLLNWYKKAIEKIKSMIDVDNIIIACDDMHVDAGICWCAEKKFNQYIINDPWVKSLTPANKIFWTKAIISMSADSNTKEDIIDSLQYRVNRLQEYVDQSPDKTTDI